MATVTFITNEQENDIVSEMIKNDNYVNLTGYIDSTKTKKANDITSRIKAVYLYSEHNPNYRNIVNEKIIFKEPLCCDDNHPKCERIDFGNFSVSASIYPVGDAFILLNTQKLQK